jgi:NADPH-dependent 2,4-dienoyl-CoA reductase/sulfur reductase-like enzyme/ferredoxin/pSer/pThr/pTyr-binding forkhead associated (FHA) protein
MASEAVVEIRELGHEPRRVTFDRAIEVGRDCDGEVIQDDGVSRRHLKLVPSPIALSVVDLGSRNGTLLNGQLINGRSSLKPGDVLRLGRAEIFVVQGLVAQSPQPARETLLTDTKPIPAPPLPKAAAPSRWVSVVHLAKRIVGAETGSEPTFPTYTELPYIMPRPLWYGIRAVSVAAYLALCITLFVRPAGGLFWFFKVIVPLLPVLFFVAPGLWRNICPLAASNQTPRVFGFTRGLTAPAWLAEWGYVIAISLFLGIAAARLAFFNSSGTSTGVLLSVVIISAFLGGLLLKGKSGWCSSVCPLLPLQRVYGQTPFVTVANSHCQPCVGCTTNCYDFNPRVAYQADLHDQAPQWSATRKLFASALPGFVLGFFMLLGQAGGSRVHLYEQLGLYVVGSIGTFFALDALLPVSTAVLVAFFASGAINVFYWYASVTLAQSFLTVTGVDISWVRWPIRGVVWALSLIWISRTYFTERRYLEESSPIPTPVKLSPKGAKVASEQSKGGDVSVHFVPDDKVAAAEVGISVLEVAEKEGQTIEAGCRMGVCGADPVAIVEGAECLSKPEGEELSTLKRLGFAANTRMACCARLESGTVTVALKPEPGESADGDGKARHFDPSIASVVVLGNGIAGVTAADFVRRGHPDCEIHIVGKEPLPLYNRMGISRLIYGRSAMQGLYLLAEQWYDDHGITAWINTVATKIDLDSKRVLLGTGDYLPFDRLILGLGSSGFVPPIDGFGAPGTFVLREAPDAIDIRAYAQDHRCRTAVVAGGGLLGLEAAHSLHELGLRVTVLERGDRLLAKQIDPRCSELLQAHFEELGIEILHHAETESVSSGRWASSTRTTRSGRVRNVRLKDGRTLPCDVFLACVGIRPNVTLAEEAGLAVGRGVIVDNRMETSVPGVFAAGDIAEFNGQVLGLWPIASKQAEVAAINALGGDERLASDMPAAILKGVGLELTSVGRVEAGDGDVVVVCEDAHVPSYRRLLVAGGKAAGVVVLGHHPNDAAAATAAVKKGTEVSPSQLDSLRRGDWQVLKKTAGPVVRAERKVTKADFTPEEWDLILEGPPSAGILVVTAQRGGTVREKLGMADAYIEARHQHGESELLDEIVAAKREHDHKRYHSSVELKEHALQHLRDAIALMERKATSAEVEEYRRFVINLAEKVARSHRMGQQTVSEAERAAIEEISASLAARTDEAVSSPSTA